MIWEDALDSVRYGKMARGLLEGRVTARNTLSPTMLDYATGGRRGRVAPFKGAPNDGGRGGRKMARGREKSKKQRVVAVM